MNIFFSFCGCINPECKFFIDDEDYRSQSEMLCKKIKELKTTVIILPWCYSTNRDVCMALRNDVVLNHLFLEADMRNILIDLKNPKLSYQQYNILQRAQEKKDLILTGQTGTGKTMLAMEAVKIKISQYLEKSRGNSENLYVYITSMNITLKTWLENDVTNKSHGGLLDDIKNKWMNNIEHENIYFKGFGEFLESYGVSSVAPYISLRNPLETLGKLLSEKPYHFIIMIDEVDFDYLDCKSEHLCFDLSELSNYNNVNFIINFSPIPSTLVTQHMTSESWKLCSKIDFPNCKDNQHFEWLKKRYRNTNGILNFNNFFQENILKKELLSCFSDFHGVYLTTEHDEICEFENLPVPLCSPPVQWLVVSHGEQDQAPDIYLKIQAEVFKTLQDLKLHEPDKNRNFNGGIAFIAEDYGILPYEMKGIFYSLMENNPGKQNDWKFYERTNFIGCEADVVVYFRPKISHDIFEMDLQIISRARRFLLIVNPRPYFRLGQVEEERKIITEACGHD